MRTNFIVSKTKDPPSVLWGCVDSVLSFPSVVRFFLVKTASKTVSSFAPHRTKYTEASDPHAEGTQYESSSNGFQKEIVWILILSYFFFSIFAEGYASDFRELQPPKLTLPCEKTSNTTRSQPWLRQRPPAAFRSTRIRPAA